MIWQKLIFSFGMGNNTKLKAIALIALHKYEEISRLQDFFSNATQTTRILAPHYLAAESKRYQNWALHGNWCYQDHRKPF